MSITSLADQLLRDEGLRLKPYRDQKGKLTIGIGRNLDDDGISATEAQILLADDIANVTHQLAVFLPWSSHLDPIRCAVLQNMIFNMGMEGLLEFRHTLFLVQAGSYEEAATEMLDSEWAKEVGPRAQRLAVQMRTGQWQ